MKPEKQRLAIAEACGWKFHKIKGEFRFTSICPDGYKAFAREYGDISHLPDYLNDLNAMNEAEKMMTWEQKEDYSMILTKMTMDNADPLSFGSTHATAYQRAEAFLRTIGKWEDDA